MLLYSVFSCSLLYLTAASFFVSFYGSTIRQCDIVIYDTLLYPSLLSLTNIHFFPVDIVYATIEVKTTLTSGSVKEALTNIASVQQLNFINDQFADTDIRNS